MGGSRVQRSCTWASPQWIRCHGQGLAMESVGGLVDVRAYFHLHVHFDARDISREYFAETSQTIAQADRSRRLEKPERN